MTEVSQCFDLTSKDNTMTNLKKLQSLGLDDKILYTTVKIQQFYLRHKGKVYVSFSGGKDSTVLLHLVRSIYPDVKGVFFDTGLEYPEIRDYVKTYDNIDWVKPKMSFRKVIDTYGYPVIGKMASHWINGAKQGWASAPKHFETDDSIYGYKRYAYMIDAPFKVSERCCDVLKKRPAKAYYKETGLAPMLGIRADESFIRRDQFKNKGDDKEDTAYPQLNPLAIWTDNDIKEYIKRYDIRLAEVYYMPGIERTGCVFCMFGIMKDRDRFVKLKITHPQLWEYCMKDYDKGGLGLKKVLDYMHIPTGYEQKNLLDFSEDKE